MVAANKQRRPLARTSNLVVAAAGKGFGKAGQQQQKKKKVDEVGVPQCKHSRFGAASAATPPPLLQGLLQSWLQDRHP